MAIAAAAVLLLLAAVGGGIDMSRAYMAKTNLQSACDAGALAGRKAMASTGVYTDAEKAKADKMFDFNAKLASTDSELVGEFETEADDEGAVNGSAAITMPTVIMKMFGFDTFDLSVQCSAELQMSSADIIFVLDTTGSMAGSKIQALRDAVKEFHKTVAAAVIDKEQTRIRYAFVPYSMTVNVSRLISSGAMPTSYIANSTPYQTRLAYFDTTPDVVSENNSTSTETTYTDSAGHSINEYGCHYGYNNYANNWGNDSNTTGTPPSRTTTISYSYRDWRSSDGRCRRYKKTTTRDYAYQFTEWRYKKATVSTAGFTSGSVSLVTDLNESGSNRASSPSPGYYDIRALAALSGTTGLSKSNVTWSGCIEERHTVVDYAMDPIPSDANDLDIISAPTSNDATQWKPYIGELEFDRGSWYQEQRDTTSDINNESENCPAPIRQFQEVDTTNPTTVPEWLNDYLDDLVAKGSTYHDLGMIWGARIGSTRGIFAENVNEGENLSVSRHIIFMTDGDMDPSISSYSAYGLQYLDGRVAPVDTSERDIEDYHNNRFLAACREAEAEGYTIWLIAFGTTVTSQMLECSTADRAFKADDATELNNTFKFIAGQVADLRINR